MNPHRTRHTARHHPPRPHRQHAPPAPRQPHRAPPQHPAPRQSRVGQPRRQRQRPRRLRHRPDAIRGGQLTPGPKPSPYSTPPAATPASPTPCSAPPWTSPSPSACPPTSPPSAKTSSPPTVPTHLDRPSRRLRRRHPQSPRTRRRRARQLLLRRPVRQRQNWRAHYHGTANEIWQQTEGRITHFVAGLGTSGTFMGTTRRLHELNPRIQCISMQPDSPFNGFEGLKHMATAIVPPIYDPTLADRNIDMPTERAYAHGQAPRQNPGPAASASPPPLPSPPPSTSPKKKPAPTAKPSSSPSSATPPTNTSPNASGPNHRRRVTRPAAFIRAAPVRCHPERRPKDLRSSIEPHH